MAHDGTTADNQRYNWELMNYLMTGASPYAIYDPQAAYEEWKIRHDQP